MTDLYGVRIESIEGALLKMRVFQTYLFFEEFDGKSYLERTLPYADSADFFVRVLLDHVRGKTGSLTDLISKDERYDEDWLLDNAARFISSIEELESHNRGADDPSAFANFYHHQDGGWENEDQLPNALYRIKVEDAAWLNHLEPNDSWGTTAYFIE